MVVSVGCRRCYSKLSNELSNLYNNPMREPYVREIIPGGKWRWKLKDVEVQECYLSGFSPPPVSTSMRPSTRQRTPLIV